MNRSWTMAVLSSLALASVGAATGALAVEPGELAPPGVCATESRELQRGPITSAADPGDGGDGSAGSVNGPESVIASSGGAPGASTTAGGPNAGASSPGGGTTATGAPRVHLTPIQVAANPVPFSGPRPLPQAFPGPGPCDQPGSGCQGPVQAAPAPPVFVDPAPTGGCNFPGCKP